MTAVIRRQLNLIASFLLLCLTTISDFAAAPGGPPIFDRPFPPWITVPPYDSITDSSVILEGTVYGAGAQVYNVSVNDNGFSYRGLTNNISSNIDLSFSAQVYGSADGRLVKIVATDTLGRTATNQTTIYSSSNYVRIITPRHHSALTNRSQLEIQVEAFAATQSFARVEVEIVSHNGDVVTNLQLTAPPFNFIWNTPDLGIYWLHAKGIIEGERASLAQPIQFSIVANDAVVLYPGPSPRIVPRGSTITIFPTVAAKKASWQWFLNDAPVTNTQSSPTLTITNINSANQGVYTLRALPFPPFRIFTTNIAEIIVTEPYGAYVDFDNLTESVDAMGRFSTNGIPLGINAVAQLFAGPNIFEMKPWGPVVPFENGYFSAGPVIIPNVQPGEKAIVQVRAWANFPSYPEPPTSSYESYRYGGHWGKSKIIEVTTQTNFPGAPMIGLQPFHLEIWDGYSFFAQPATPTDYVVAQGQPATLTATGTVTYTWQQYSHTNFSCLWRKDGQILTAQTNFTLHIPSTQPSDTGNYTVALTDGIEIRFIDFRLRLGSGIAFTTTRVETPSGPQLQLNVSGPAGIPFVIQTSGYIPYIGSPYGSIWHNWKTVESIEPGFVLTNIPIITLSNNFFRAYSPPEPGAVLQYINLRTNESAAGPPPPTL